jgi:hypothetical protein
MVSSSDIVLHKPRWITQVMKSGRCGWNDGWLTYVSRLGRQRATYHPIWRIQAHQDYGLQNNRFMKRETRNQVGQIS